MRITISIIIASLFFVGIIYLSYSENFVLSDYWTALAILLTGTAITVLGWGFKPSIENFLQEQQVFSKTSS